MPTPLELNWSQETITTGGFTQDTGGINVGVSYVTDGSGTSFSNSTSPQFVGTGETFSTSSSLQLGGDMVDAGDAIIPGDTGEDDLIEAGAGNDTVIAGNGADEVYAGTGDDLISADSGDDTVFGGEGDDEMSAGIGTDTL